MLFEGAVAFRRSDLVAVTLADVTWHPIDGSAGAGPPSLEKRQAFRVRALADGREAATYAQRARVRWRSWMPPTSRTQSIPTSEADDYRVEFDLAVAHTEQRSDQKPTGEKSARQKFGRSGPRRGLGAAAKMDHSSPLSPPTSLPSRSSDAMKRRGTGGGLNEGLETSTHSLASLASVS